MIKKDIHLYFIKYRLLVSITRNKAKVGFSIYFEAYVLRYNKLKDRGRRLMFSRYDMGRFREGLTGIKEYPPPQRAGSINAGPQAKVCATPHIFGRYL